MEDIFIDSEVLKSMAEEPLTREYINKYYTELVPDYYIVENLKNDFDFLVNNQLENIDDLENIILIVHKYRINKFYDKLIEHLAWKIMRLEFCPKNLCTIIKNDIIRHNPDFSSCLKYLIFKDMTNLKPEDYLFSLPLMKKKRFLYQLSPEMPIKYEIFDVVKYLVENNKCEKSDVCMFTAIYGKLEILKWARMVGCPWEKWMPAHAAEHGHFELLKWIMENGCEWQEYACNYAAKKGNFEILKWAVESGYPICKTWCSIAAKKNPEILEWLKTLEQ